MYLGLAKDFASFLLPFFFPSLSVELLLLLPRFTAEMMGGCLHSQVLCSTKFCLCSKASSTEALFTLIFQQSTKTFVKFLVTFFAAVQGFWEIPLGQLPPLSLPTVRNTSTCIYTATSSELVHPSHIFISQYLTPTRSPLWICFSLVLKQVFPPDTLCQVYL